MLKKNKKNLLLAGGLLSALITSSAVGIALSSCTTTSSTTKPTESEAEYTTQINWDDSNTYSGLTKDDQGVYYSDDTMTTVIALSPSSKAATITLPATVTTISGYINVTGSGESQTSTQTGAFEDNTSITNIKVSSGTKLTTINKRAFKGCTALTSLSDTSGVTKVGAGAFYQCTALQEINLTKTQIIGNSAFSGAFSSEANIAITLSNVLSIANSAFNKSNITSVSIGTVSSLAIGISAFSGCTKLTTVTFTNTANNTPISLGYGAFEKCTALATLTFPPANTSKSNLITIGQSAFDGCTSLETTHLGNVSLVGANAFEGCSKLTTVTLPDNSNSVLTTIGSLAFGGCGLLKTVAPLAPSGSTQVTGFVSTSSMSVIGAYAFGRTAIASIDLTNFKGTISNGATITGSTKSFASIPNLSSVNLGETITILEADDKQQGLFYGSGTSSDGFDLVLSSNITSISAGAFAGSGVKSIDMSKVTSYSTTSDGELALPNYLFNGATKLTSVVLKVGTTSIGDYDFQNCTSLKVVKEDGQSYDSGYVATSTITSIGNGAFNNAFAANSSATIDLSAASLTTIPAGFTSGNISSVKLPSTATSVGANTFFGNSNLTSLTIGASGLASSSALFTGSGITKANESKTDTPATYKAANLPFGSNTKLTSLYYNNFTSVGATSTATAQALFETTSKETWEEVTKIINSLSNYDYNSSSGENNAANIPANLSAWTATSEGATRTTTILDDSTITSTNASSGKLASVVFYKCFSTANDNIGHITINSGLTSNSFIHNGVTWNYKNDGTNITLTGAVNMYKTTVTSNNTSNSFLTFFDTQQAQFTPSGGTAITYKIPSLNKVLVTLTIATKSAT